MKTPAPLSKAMKWRGSSADFIRRVPGQIFGNVSWQRPHWLNRIGDDWDRVERAHPRLIAPAILGIFLICCAGAWTWNWYSHLPKPRRVTARVEAIPVTKL